jgi:nucleoside phosphorylase
MAAAPTIGIVTAVPEEFATVVAFIDEPSPDFVHDDRWSTYRTGTMPSANTEAAHQVVVTMATRAGSDVAARATTNLIRRYPTVSLVIMCGICVGTPIRAAYGADHLTLSGSHTGVAPGDVVVATSGAVDDDASPPSARLTAAANVLCANAKVGRRPWEAWLDPAARGLPAAFRRPEAPDRFSVHYGSIRSTGNDGRGFLRGLEWFAVRGVSDDAEPRWRPAAALAAAAYTRALLGECATVAPRTGVGRPGLPNPVPAAGATCVPASRVLR